MKKNLLKWGYEYREINISYDVSWKPFLKERNHRTVPQLYLEEDDNLKHLNKVATDLFTKEILEKEIQNDY